MDTQKVQGLAIFQKSSYEQIQKFVEVCRLRFISFFVFTILIATISNSVHAVCVDSGVNGPLTAAQATLGITTTPNPAAPADDGQADHVLDTITFGGTTFTDFINPTGYNFLFTALPTSVPPGSADLTRIYRMDAGDDTTTFNDEGAANWPAAILDIYQSRNLNLYQGYDTDVNTGDFWEVTYATPVSSTAGLFVGWTERAGNNGVSLQAFDAAGVALDSPVVVTPGAGGVFTPPVSYIGTGVEADALSGANQEIGMALFPIDDLAPVGSQVSSIRVFPVASTTDAGDGKVFIFGDEDVADCVVAAPSIELIKSVMDVADTCGYQYQFSVW